ncbi:hypothetical protein LIER_10630 [Lithospermum erythrorhizon]|uniref:Uncharacterized protein n=1 Tax=Lithospermum erythrorhizon TaxID=34254 RepID=A0AAV3PM23_LITER
MPRFLGGITKVVEILTSGSRPGVGRYNNNDGVEVNENANDIEKGAVHENEKVVDVDDEVNEKDKEDDVENEEENNDFEYSESDENEESDSEEDGKDEDLDPEDVLYGKEQDGFDDGDLPRDQPTLSATFLENIEEAFVVPEHMRPHVRTCPKKKAEVEGDIGNSRIAIKKKATSTSRPSQTNAARSSQSMPATPATGKEEIIDPKQLVHEQYLHNLYNWMNDMRRIVPVLQTMPAIPQTPSQPVQPYPQEVPPQTPVEPIIQYQVPKMPGNKTTLTMSSSQPVPNADTVIKKMRKIKGKSQSQGG